MSETILKVENIAKQYRLGTVGTGTIGHDLNRWWHKVRGKEDPYLKVGAINDRSAEASSDYVWALRDISFEVKRGEVLGIIGKNGAGKSTLLKILSRVTSPTLGSIKTKGRIASLLEVGTGMHPELTGRENVYLNGAILGMTKAEIRAKIDEIVEFSGCQMYIDTPVKRYSSGMRVRLGFAVAAFLEPDILVVDEVLAVGDADFQKKAIGKMQDISTGGGRTVLFVSHNMATIKSLCSRIIVLDNGTVDFEGDTVSGISHYLSEKEQVVYNQLIEATNRSGNGLVRFSDFHFEDALGKIVTSTLTGDDLVLCFSLALSENFDKDAKIDLGFSFHASNGVVLSVLYSSFQHIKISGKPGEIITVKCAIKDLSFNQGEYTVKGRILYNGEESDWLKDRLGTITVLKGDYYETGNLGFDGTSQYLVKGIWSVNS